MPLLDSYHAFGQRKTRTTEYPRSEERSEQSPMLRGGGKCTIDELVEHA